MGAPTRPVRPCYVYQELLQQPLVLRLVIPSAEIRSALASLPPVSQQHSVTRPSQPGCHTALDLQYHRPSLLVGLDFPINLQQSPSPVSHQWATVVSHYIKQQCLTRFPELGFLFSSFHFTPPPPKNHNSSSSIFINTHLPKAAVVSVADLDRAPLAAVPRARCARCPAIHPPLPL